MKATDCRLVELSYGDTTGAKRRKLAVDIGPALKRTNVGNKRRIRVWHDETERFGDVRAVDAARILGPAPEDWPETPRARRGLLKLDF